MSLNLYQHPILSFTEMAKSTSELNQAHAQMLKIGLIHDPFSAGRLISTAASSRSFTYAQSIFTHLQNPNSFSYNTMIRAYATSPTPHQSLVYFLKMLHDDDVEPDNYTFTFALKACSILRGIVEGKQVHGHVIKFGIEEDVFICNTLIHMYANCGCFDVARWLLDKMPERDVISWNAILSAYVEMGLMVFARGLFDEMPERNLESWNYMISGYVGNGLLEEARVVFNEMPVKNVVSWDAMISGYAQVGQFNEVFALFEDMQVANIMPDNYTLVNVLAACAGVGGLTQGEWVHAYIDKNGIDVSGLLATALLDMYSKCGCVEQALEVFQNTLRKDISTWNAMIAGLSLHGLGEQALKIFSELQVEGFKPNEITFVSVLSACSRAGLLDKGREMFDQMVHIHGIQPTTEHYGCIVDLLGQFGLLEEAEGLARKVPYKEAQVVWESLLGACRRYGDAERAERVARELLEMDPLDSAG